MVYKKVGLIMGLIIVLFSFACVPQQDYNKVKSELAVAQTKIVALQDQVNSLQNQVVTKEVELKSAKDKLSQIGSRIEILNWYFFSPGAKNMGDSNVVYYDKMRDKINSSNDQALIASFKIADTAATTEAFTIFWRNLWQSTLDMAK